jgi:hypothetical protein
MKSEKPDESQRPGAMEAHNEAVEAHNGAMEAQPGAELLHHGATEAFTDP